MGMNRREVLKLGAVAAAGSISGGALATQSSQTPLPSIARHAAGEPFEFRGILENIYHPYWFLEKCLQPLLSLVNLFIKTLNY